VTVTVPTKVFAGSASAVASTLMSYLHPLTDLSALYIPYASFTAALVAKAVVQLTRNLGSMEVIDTVFAGAGGTHSWWEGAGGPLLEGLPLQPGDKLEVIVTAPSVTEVAFRIRVVPVRPGVA